jgi:hypothetical protein
MGPSLRLVAKDFVDSGLVVVGVVVGAGEVIPVVFLGGVLLAAPGEVETEPGVDFVGVGGRFISVIWVDFLCFAFLLVICGRFVIENCRISLCCGKRGKRLPASQ